MLFRHYCRRFGVDVMIGSADPQRVHAIFEYSAADSQQVGGMGLDVVRSFEGIQDNFALEFHDGFFEGQSPSKGVVAQ